MKREAIKRNLLLGCLIVGAVGAIATGASAGRKDEYPVSITGILLPTGTGSPLAATQATGQVGSVRAAADTTQYIGCYTSYESMFASGLGFSGCFARNASGTTITCTSTAADFRAAVRSINSQSYISFAFLQGTSTCATLYVENGSNLRTSAP